MLQRCFRDASEMLQRCFRDASEILQRYFRRSSARRGLVDLTPPPRDPPTHATTTTTTHPRRHQATHATTNQPTLPLLPLPPPTTTRAPPPTHSTTIQLPHHRGGCRAIMSGDAVERCCREMLSRDDVGRCRGCYREMLSDRCYREMSVDVGLSIAYVKPKRFATTTHPRHHTPVLPHQSLIKTPAYQDYPQDYHRITPGLRAHIVCGSVRAHPVVLYALTPSGGSFRLHPVCGHLRRAVVLYALTPYVVLCASTQ